MPLADGTAEGEEFAVASDEAVPLHRVVDISFAGLVDACDADSLADVESAVLDLLGEGVELGSLRLASLTEVDRVVEAVLGGLDPEPGVVLVDSQASRGVGGAEGLEDFEDVEANHRAVDLLVRLGLLLTLGKGALQFDNDTLRKQFDDVFHDRKDLVNISRRGTAPRYSLGVGGKRCILLSHTNSIISHKFSLSHTDATFPPISFPTLTGASRITGYKFFQSGPRGGYSPKEEKGRGYLYIRDSVIPV